MHRDCDSFDLAELRRQVKPFRLHWFPRLRSTNEHAARLRKRGELFAPALVVASVQTNGRGRAGATWWSGQGSLTATFVLPIAEHLRPQQIPLLAGLAVRNALQQIIGSDDSRSIQLKWPNDLLHDNRKLGGLLCERLDGVDLVGVGLNLNVLPGKFPRSIRARSASLREICGIDVNPTRALANIARHLHARLSRQNELHFGQVIREYHQHHALVGRRVEVARNVHLGSRSTAQPVSGVCVGLDGTGRLLLRDLRDKSQLHRVIAGHVLAHEVVTAETDCLV